MSKEGERLLNLISDIEEKLGILSEDEDGIMLTETEKISLERAKLRLSEIEKSNADELQRIINDSIEAGEGFFPKEQYREIKKE